MAQDVGMVWKYCLSFPSCLVGFWGFHPYMHLFLFRKIFVTSLHGFVLFQLAIPLLVAYSMQKQRSTIHMHQARPSLHFYMLQTKWGRPSLIPKLPFCKRQTCSGNLWDCILCVCSTYNACLSQLCAVHYSMRYWMQEQTIGAMIHTTQVNWSLNNNLMFPSVHVSWGGV